MYDYQRQPNSGMGVLGIIAAIVLTVAVVVGLYSVWSARTLQQHSDQELTSYCQTVQRNIDGSPMGVDYNDCMMRGR